jgi:hypothetical protein
MGRAFWVVVALVATGCRHELAPDEAGDDASSAADEGAAYPTYPAADGDETNTDAAGDDENTGGAGDDADDGDAAGDPGADGPGPDDTPAPPGPPPADAGQACAEWTDCGPRFADPNSGFDCVNETCTCNADGNWDDACAGIGGFWSDEECFCFVSTQPAPREDADDWTADDERDPVADRQCWWVWKERCEPDRWVDTSEYVWVCRTDDDCGYRYRAGGYWESGECDGYWIRRCDDGTEKRYGP